MPYRSYQFRISTRTEFAAAIRAFLLNQGWEDHDTYGEEPSTAYLTAYYGPYDGHTTVIGSKTYVFKDTLTPSEGEVLIDGSFSNALDNLKLAVNRTDPGTNDGVKYSIAEAHPDVIATDNEDGGQYFEQIAPGEGYITVGGNWPWASWSQQFIYTGKAAVRVYKSRGESGDEPPGYLWIDNNRESNVIIFRAYQYWDAVAHEGTRRAYMNYEPYSMISEFSDTYDCFIAGDKNMVAFMSNASRGSAQAYSSAAAGGHMPVKFHPQLTNTTDDIESGDNVSVPVVSSVGFKLGQEIQIVGVSEGCDKVVINSIPDSEHIVLANVPRNYASGAFMGLPASTFGMFHMQNGWFYPCSYFTDAELTVSASGWTWVPMMVNHSYAMSQDKRRMACPWLASIDGISNIGTLGEDIICAYLGATYDVAVMNDDGSTPMTSTVTSATGTGIEDEAKDWVPDALIGKYIVLTSNLGIGQVRKIIGNDETTLTIGYPWVENPDNQTAYKICDKVFRGEHCVLSGHNMVCFRITDDGVPELPT